MKRISDEEFHFPEDEFNTVSEFSEAEEEYPQEGKRYGRDEIQLKNNDKPLKKYIFAQAAAAIAAITVFISAVGADPLRADFLNDSSESVVETSTAALDENESESVTEQSTQETTVETTQEAMQESTQESFEESLSSETADAAFPVLSNLEPNGPVEGFGVLDEEFIRLETGSSQIFIHGGDAYGPVSIASIPGIEYDESTNTLTLDNFTGPVLNVNLMGNGFTINLKGENHLGYILIWGFYYGGSVKITGDGSLTINDDMSYQYGIFLNSEYSQSCLMVDKDVKLDVSGSEAAVMAAATNMEKAIYYLYPLTLNGGVRTSGYFVMEEDASEGGQFKDYTIVDEGTGEPAKHVVFE